jgi:hypothetical protein
MMSLDWALVCDFATLTGTVAKVAGTKNPQNLAH